MAKTLPVSVIERHEPRAIAATSSGYDTPEPVHVPRGEAETRVVKGPPKGLDTANAHADLATPYDDEPPIDDLDILDEDERRELEERRG